MGEMATHVAAAAGHVEVLEESCLIDNGISVAWVLKISGAGVTIGKNTSRCAEIWSLSQPLSSFWSVLVILPPC